MCPHSMAREEACQRRRLVNDSTDVMEAPYEPRMFPIVAIVPCQDVTLACRSGYALLESRYHSAL